jgi:hypothetical protein
LTLFFLLLLGALGCGRKGPPVPPADRAQVFAGVSVDTGATTVLQLARTSAANKNNEIHCFMPQNCLHS